MFRRAIIHSVRALQSRSTTTAATTTATPTATGGITIATSRPLQVYNSIIAPTPTLSMPIWRWYSTEPQKEERDPTEKAEASVNGKTEGSKGSEGNGVDGVGGVNNNAATMLEENKKYKSDLDAKVKEAVELKDKYFRSVAEFRNLQDRTVREVRQAKDFAISNFARDLIETIDTLDLALSAVPEASRTSDLPEKKDLVDLYNGLKMTEGALLNTLKKHGLEKVHPLGEKFDPNLHEATFQAKVEGKEAGTVFQVLRTGFLLNGRVVRAAVVGVVQAAE